MGSETIAGAVDRCDGPAFIEDRPYGRPRRSSPWPWRGWRKRHRGVDQAGVIRVHTLTEETGDDATIALDRLTAVKGPLVRVTADAASDTVAIDETARARGATVVVPPARTATVSGHGPRSPARDRTIPWVKTLGRCRWKQVSGSHRQGRVENTCFRDTAKAFCDALRARDQVALWIASRGFGGKTFLLALLAAANAILFETDVIILGGSGQQSLRVVEHLHRLWAAGQVPRAWLASEPSLNKTTLAWGNTIQALTASQTAVRGAHPTRLLLDEIDEMKLSILEAAQGQPMDRDGVRAQTVMSSTHQHPDGTVTAMRRRAADLGWPVYEWCYRETLEPHGWLTEDQVVRKQAELSRTMWAVEYELQEPSAEGRAIDPTAVERMFDATLGTHIPAGDLEHTWRGQPGPPAERACPDPAGAWYCIGVDWAQKRHYTVAVVVRCDTTPLQVVAVYRIQRRPWPEMTERVGALLDEFPGPAVHDATGAGSAIGEFPALEAHRQLQGVTMVGRDRVDLFRNYIAAIERDEIVCPRIDVFYTEHLYCGEDDLFGSGHPPDTVVAMALAYHAFKTGRRPGDYGVTI